LEIVPVIVLAFSSTMPLGLPGLILPLLTRLPVNELPLRMIVWVVPVLV
jgi:hypothetical protein